ncbi:MAG: hypothetical protein E3J52_12490 [Promethearchaeota archaeon]|nr:MAG: hypothetical protein E3J52_12490 [Candidatus Lokiarchaeota archaeon]
MEVFLKRAERSFKEKLGEDKTTLILNNIKKATNEIPAKFRRVIGSEIPKFLFNYSQEIEDVSPGITEGVLNYIFIFAESLKDLVIKDRNQVNQMLIKRSNNSMRNLSDLLNAFVEKAKNGAVVENLETFEDLLTYMVGGKAEVTQLSDVELFIKRAEKNFSEKLGEDKSQKYSVKIKKTFEDIDESHRDYMSSEMSKYLFKFSQHLDGLSNETLEKILTNILVFSSSITDLNGKNRDQINQEIRKRSDNKLGSLLDLFKTSIKEAKENNLLDTSKNLEDILTHLFGEEEKRVQFTDVEAFLKRAEKKYSFILGQDMIQMLMEELLDAIEQMPEQHRGYLGSDLSKYLFKYSETASYHEPEKVELVFNGAIMFANSLVDIGDLNKAEINQFIINRSNHKVRGLFDLYLAFLKKIEIRMPLSLEPNFDEILVHTLGRYSGPKVLDQGGLIHDLLSDHHEEIPLAIEHSNWAKALIEIIPRYLDILPKAEGDRVLDFLWENKFPEDQIIEKYRSKISEMPREKEKTFMFRLMNMLTNQILVDVENDKVLAGALALRILGGIFVEIFGGRNAQIRAIRLNQLLKDRKVSNIENKKKIDEHINKILEEDLKAIQKRTMTINTIIPILNKKRYFIKTYDIVTKDFPEFIVKMITVREEDRLKDIGEEYKKPSVSGDLIPLVNNFLMELDLARRFYKKYFEEMYSIATDAQKNMLTIRKFFKSLLELSDNMDAIEFFERPIANTEHTIYISLLKYLFDCLPEVFEITRTILDEQEYQRKIMKLDTYLSNWKLEQLNLEISESENKIKEYEEMEEWDATDKIRNLTKSLNRDKNELKFYDIMFRLLNETEKTGEILNIRLNFSKSLLKYSNSLKKVHPNLPAALHDYLENLNEFTNEIDKIIEELKKKSASGIISPFDFRERQDAAEMSKKELLSLGSNEEFMNHIKSMFEISKTNPL